MSQIPEIASTENITPESQQKTAWLNKAIIPGVPAFNVELLIFGIIILLVVLSRFYDLGARVMSHDESLHTYFSWQLYKGQGYAHNPMMHGPLQFHLLALSYFLFGVSDFTARIPAAIFSIATVWMVWYWRRYLGRTGALVAGFLALISPFLLYYGRYVRNESFVGLVGILMLLATLRYFETGEKKYIYWFVLANALHFTVKETSFIYAAEMLLFLGMYFIVRVTRTNWKNPEYQRPFIIALIVTLLIGLAAFGIQTFTGGQSTIGSTETAVPLDPTAATPAAIADFNILSPIVLGAGLALIGVAVAIYLLIRGYTVEGIKKERSFDLLIVLGTMVLPQLAALPIAMVGWNPLDYSTEGMLHTAVFVVPLILISIAIGWWWNFDTWWKSALIFWGIFTLFYTTVFTNGPGFFTGIVGALGYWLEQHGVERGSQPWYFYIFIQIPIYEFLPAIGSLLAIKLSTRFNPNLSTEDEEKRTNMLALLGWWTIISIIAFSWAGEKMPWLAFHMALPMVLLAGWAIGQVIDNIDWQSFSEQRGLVIVVVIAVLLMSGFGVIRSTVFSATPPFQGSELNQLEVTASFMLALVTFIASAAGLYYLLRNWKYDQFANLTWLVFFGILAVLTTKSTIVANYINYDSAKEYLVYAHGYTGVKDVMSQVDELSERISGGTSMVVAYDDDVPWPFSWYLRDYTNARYFGNAPTRDLRDVPVIIVGDNNFGKIEPVVGQSFYPFEYIRMVWPNQDYFNVVTKRLDPAMEFQPDYACTGALSFLRVFKSYDFSRLCRAIIDPNIREGIFDIWLNRDYTKYAEATGSQSLTPESWSPADRMRLYIRKDIAAQIWNYGIGPAAVEIQADPYEAGFITLSANQVVGTTGIEAGQFNAPRGLAVASDNSIYIADSRNHRIQHFAADGQLITTWGYYADNALAAAPLGAFNEPWGVAVGPDGSVYVSDTWNHRIQKFTAVGQPLTTWGAFGFSSESPLNFYGPRGIAVDSNGHVYVSDTGNKRIAIFDENGTYITEIGQAGFGIGEFDEPVDVAVDDSGNVYVTDTWNQRIQVFAPSGDQVTYFPTAQWDIAGWYGTSIENKPFIAISPVNGHVFVTDPEAFRVIEFASDGTFVRTWGQYGFGMDSFVLPSGIKVDALGNIWVSDGVNGETANNRLLRFTAP